MLCACLSVHTLAVRPLPAATCLCRIVQSCSSRQYWPCLLIEIHKRVHGANSDQRCLWAVPGKHDMVQGDRGPCTLTGAAHTIHRQVPGCALMQCAQGDQCCAQVLPGEFVQAGRQGSSRLGEVRPPTDLAPNTELLDPQSFR